MKPLTSWVYRLTFLLIHFAMGAFLLWLLRTHAIQIFGGYAELHPEIEGLGESAWLLLGVLWGSSGWDSWKELVQMEKKGLSDPGSVRSDEPFFHGLKITVWLYAAAGVSAFGFQAFEKRGFPEWPYFVILMLAFAMLFVHPWRYWRLKKSDESAALEERAVPSAAVAIEVSPASRVMSTPQKVMVAGAVGLLVAHFWGACRRGRAAKKQSS